MNDTAALRKSGSSTLPHSIALVYKRGFLLRTQSQYATRQRASHRAVAQHCGSVHDHVRDAFRIVMWIFVCRDVPHRGRVEDDEIRLHAATEDAAVDEART